MAGCLLLVACCWFLRRARTSIVPTDISYSHLRLLFWISMLYIVVEYIYHHSVVIFRPGSIALAFEFVRSCLLYCIPIPRSAAYLVAVGLIANSISRSSHCCQHRTLHEVYDSQASPNPLPAHTPGRFHLHMLRRGRLQKALLETLADLSPLVRCHHTG